FMTSIARPRPQRLPATQAWLGGGVPGVARRAPPAPQAWGESAAPSAAPHTEGDAAARARPPDLGGRGARLSPPAVPCPRPAPPRIGGPGGRARNSGARPT